MTPSRPNAIRSDLVASGHCLHPAAVQISCRKNLDAAKAAAALILKQAEILEAFPSAGRPSEDLEPEHRELLIPFGSAGYVLLYHFDEDRAAVTVLSIRHQKEVGY